MDDNLVLEPVRSVILNQFFYGGKQFVRNDVMNAIRNEIHNRDNIIQLQHTPNDSNIRMHIKEKQNDEIQ